MMDDTAQTGGQPMGMNPGQPQHAAMPVTDDTFEMEVLKYAGVVLVDFWATWCGPCKIVGPIVEEVAQEMKGMVKVCKLDVDENPNKAQEYGVMSIPTLMIFQNGKMVDMFVGARPKEDIIGRLKKFLPAENMKKEDMKK